MQEKIDKLIIKQLTDNISAEETEVLNAWIHESKEHAHYYERIINDTSMRERYIAYGKINQEKAWRYFKRRCLKRQSFLPQLMRYAAVLLIPLIGIMAWLYLSRQETVKPVLSQTARLSMIKSQQMGKEKATLVLPNGNNIVLHADGCSQDSLALYNQPSAKSGDDAHQNNTLATHKGNEFWLTLEDGTIIHLNYNTTLIYPTSFGSDERRVYLKGEAYFQVAKDKRPFFVDTPNGSVKEYGTSFNVNTKEGGKTIVVLVEGSVSVLTTSGKEYMMKPGEMASIQSPLNVNINKVDVEPYIAWNKGRFVFDNYTLAQVMEVLSSWYDLDVKFTSNDIKQVHYTGSIDKYGTIQPLMNAIRGVTHLNITIRNNTIYIGK